MSLHQQDKEFLTQNLKNCVQILLRFEHPRNGHHRIDSREPLNFYLGYSGVVSSLLLALEGLAVAAATASATPTSALITSFLTAEANQQFVHALSNFLNQIVPVMLDHCENVLKEISQSEKFSAGESAAFYKREAHTLLFGQFLASLSVLHQLRWNCDSSSSPFESACLTGPTTRQRLQALLPRATSFSEILLSVYSPFDEKVDRLAFGGNEQANACEPFYGKAGLLAAFLTSITSCSCNDDASERVKQRILDEFCLPLVNSIVESGTNQSNYIRRQQQQQSNQSNQSTSVVVSAPPPPLLFFWHGTAYLGAAHGSAGIFYYCLECIHHFFCDRRMTIATTTKASHSDQKDEEKQQRQLHHQHQLQRLQEFLLRSLDETEKVAKCSATSNNYKSSLKFTPSTHQHHGSDDRLVQFCHGAPGFIFPFAAAAKITSSSSSASTSMSTASSTQLWMEKLLAAAEETWNRGCLKDSVGLCHSVSGNGFALFHVYKTISLLLLNVEFSKQKHDPRRIEFLQKQRTILWERIVAFAKESVTIAPKIHLEGDHIFSMYEGMGGTLAFVGAVLASQEGRFFAKMPGFEV